MPDDARTDSEVESAIAKNLAETHYGDALAARGQASAALNDDGRIVQRNPDGTTEVLDPPAGDRPAQRSAPHKVEPMASYTGVVTVETRSGDVVLDHATIKIFDSRTAPCPYPSRPSWWGTLEQDGTDLMGEPWRTDPDCVIRFDTADFGLARFNGWDQGGRRAQIIGEGLWPFAGV